MAERSPGRAAAILTWQPTSSLRFREQGELGMILEQLFVCITIGEENRTEWRPVPVVPESEGQSTPASCGAPR